MANTFDRLKNALADRYAILQEIGAGGMATVYLAEDLKHHRKVAVKVLRPELAAILGAERFLKEIEVTANLQHPHILPLFDSGEADSFLYYVMPHVDGESLRERLNREKQLSIEESIEITKAVASALDYAHRHEVIHRDIKPENILLHDGQPVVADFGIALAVAQAGGTRLTETGLSVGTPAYMSPEQATGERELTARSDVYSLGAVLYEMLVGEPPHTGSTAQAVIAKVVTDRARLVRELRDTVPAHVEAALEKALAKLPADRFAAAARFGDALTPTGAAPALEPSRAPAPGVAAARPRLTIEPAWLRWVIAAGAVGLVGLAVAQWLPRGTEVAGDVTRFVVPVPGGHQMQAGMFPRLAMSRDGRMLLYGSEGRLHVRPVDRIEAEPIVGSEAAGSPFFSPDGQWIGFTRSGALWKMLVGGGPVIKIANASTVFGASWGETGDIIYAAAIGDAGLRRVSADGGVPEQLTTIEDGSLETAHLWPQVLPGGDLVLFTVVGPSFGWDQARIDIQSIETGERWTVIEGGTYGRYVSAGHIVYAQATGTLLAVPFDITRREVTGPAVPALAGVRVAVSAAAASFAISDNGTLAFVRGNSQEMYLLQWVEREGTRLSQLGPPINALSQFELSPDGRRLALTIRQPNNDDIWLADAANGERERFTFEAAEDETPIWSADGCRIAYSSAGTGQTRRIYVKDVDAGSDPTLVYTGKRHLHLTSWSSDGRWLAFDELHPETGSDIWVVDVDSTEHLISVAATTAYEADAVFSPDGRWLAYHSGESGRLEVYVVSFPQVGGKRQVSTNGGGAPIWAAAGNELFYRSGTGLMAARVSTEGTFSREVPRLLFEAPMTGYDVAPDGQRFLITVPNPDAPAREIQVVVNWIEEVKAKVGNE